MKIKRKFTLRATLTIISLTVLCVTVGGVLLAGFINARSTVKAMASELMVQQSQAVSDKVHTYLGPGMKLIQFLSQAILNSPDDLVEWERSGEKLVPLADVFPQFSWIYYAEESSGQLIGVTRAEGENILHRSFFGPDGERKTFESVLKDGEWRSFTRQEVQVNSVGYDPRERPWYKNAVASDDAVWTRPYYFFQTSIEGITVAWADRDDEGNVIGVYAIDVILEDLKQFLSEIQVGENGIAMMFSEDGQVMVAPNQEQTTKDAKSILKKTRATLPKHLDELAQGEGVTIDFYHQNVWYLARVSQLGGGAVPESYLAVVVPAFDILQIARDNAVLTVLVAIILVGVSVLISMRSARVISAPLSRVSQDMAKIAQYDITAEPYDSSNIYEMAVVMGALDKMKSSLRAFGRYVPSELVRDALASGQDAEVGGKTQCVSVLFADLAGFTSMSEKMTPDEVFAELSLCLEVLTSGPERRGGAMLTFLGDGILVVFNAPKALPDHPAAACESALEILANMQQLNQQRENDGKAVFKARIGINSGEVLVGNVGIKERFSYSVLGDAVNLASRLEGLNKVYGTTILVGEACYQRCRERFEWRQVDLISVVGRSRAEKIYEPLGFAEHVAADELKSRDLYESGWQHYLRREFKSALEHFSASLQHRPGDLAACLMMERSRSLMKSPPDSDWDGSHRALSK